jgi:hypothetical protein
MKRVKGILNRSAIDKKYAPKKRRSKFEVPDKPKPTYTIKFLCLDTNGASVQYGTRQTTSYKVALREAELWTLDNDAYRSILEWETPLGEKSMLLDPINVREARKERNRFKKAVKENGVILPYISE